MDGRKTPNGAKVRYSIRVRAVVALLLAVTPALAAPPSTCGGEEDYARALCAYQRRQFAEAERLFRQIAKEEASSPQTIRAHYFLARTLMKSGRWAEAVEELRRIYRLDKPFYDAWSCDFLLGECRRALGRF